MTQAAPALSDEKSHMKLFWACFIALVATSFVFGIRANTLGALQDSLNLSEQQKGAINGAGMWPFAVSIIFFSLVIDYIGYKTVAIFAILCHLVSLYFHLQSKTYHDFYWSTLLISVANGSVESFINPVVATLFAKQKSKWLNILHAGWPAGMALGALVCLVFPNTTLFFDTTWKFRFATCLIPVVIYALLVFPCKFPVQERVAAGVSYRDMLKVFGAVGFFIFFSMLTMAFYQSRTEVINWSVVLAVGGAAALIAGIYTRSLGHWLFLVVLLTIGPLATTELGTDGWMPELLKLGGPAGVDGAMFAARIFLYTSAIMTVLRFYAGPIVHSFSPIGLLVVSAVVAIAGLMFLSVSAGWMIVAAATVYAFGKTFLWSTTLGLTAEQLPKGGALALNGVSAVGVLFLGVLGAPYLGFKQDHDLSKRLSAPEHAALYAQVKGEEKPSTFGNVPSLDQAKVAALSPEKRAELEKVQAPSKRGMFVTIAILPSFMLVCYILLWFYFKSKGGYKPVSISHGEEAEPGF
jgi:DHA2 family metal-tetracycline-proton antiporter-like MFS transporter